MAGHKCHSVSGSQDFGEIMKCGEPQFSARGHRSARAHKSLILQGLGPFLQRSVFSKTGFLKSCERFFEKPVKTLTHRKKAKILPSSCLIFMPLVVCSGLQRTTRTTENIFKVCNGLKGLHKNNFKSQSELIHSFAFFLFLLT